MSKPYTKEYLNSLIGKKFNMLTIVDWKKKGKNSSNYFVCRCDCGNIKEIRANHLFNDNHQKSCGCIMKKYKDSKKGTAIYSAWQRMIARCYKTSCERYKNYGGRGIMVCEEWKNDYNAFYQWAINNGFELGLWIDRIDNNGNYDPSNCRWTSRLVQMRNTSRNHYITYNNQTHCMAEWAEILGISYNTLDGRIHRGWSIERAFETPVRNKSIK